MSFAFSPFQIGDTVRERGTDEVRIVTGLGSDGFVLTQVGNVVTTAKMTRAVDLELVAKPPERET